MKRMRKAISILVTLAMLVGLLLPAGSAFAADAVKFTSATKTGVQRQDNQSMGWVKIDLEQPVPGNSSIYVTVNLPDGVEWNAAAAPVVGQSDTNIAVYEGASVLGAAYTEVRTKGDSSKTVKITVPSTGLTKDAYIKLSFPAVNIASKAQDDIVVKVKASEVDNDNLVVWEQSADLKVATVGDAEVKVTAETAKNISDKSGEKVGAKIVLTENTAGALSVNKKVYLELPSTYYTWSNMTNNEITAGAYGLNATVDNVDHTNKVGNGYRKLALTVSGTSTVADVLKIKPKFNVLPGASAGEVVISVTSDDSDLKDADVTVAKVGNNSITATAVDHSSAGDVLVGANTQDVMNIKLESDSDLKIDDDIVLGLPEGFEWADNGSATGLGSVSRYDDNKKMYFRVASPSDAYTITGLKVKAKKDATPGELLVTLSGVASGTVKVADVKPRATVVVEKAVVRSGGTYEAAAEFTLKETKNSAFLYSTASESGTTYNLIFSLPTGVKFADDFNIKVNNGDKKTVAAKGKEKVYYNLTGLGGTKESIRVYDLKYDVDTRVAGDITLEIGGPALTDITGSYSDAWIKVTNATALSANKAAASFVIGSTEYTVNGVKVTMDVAPYTKDGRTYMPVRYVALALGVDAANILWDGKNVTVIKGDRVIQMTIGSKVLTMNGISLPMDAAPEVKDGRTMLPFRFIAQALGASVSYDEATKTVNMNLN